VSSHSLRRRLRIGNRTAFDIPICWSMRWVFETLDGVDKLSDNLDALLAIVTDLDKLMPATDRGAAADDRRVARHAVDKDDVTRRRLGEHALVLLLA
jgi:hypothetical protein